MSKFRLPETFNYLNGTIISDTEYWIRKGEIPIGTLMPYEYYEDGNIPMDDIVTIPFDPVDESKSNTSRKAMNMLVLGGSGDGKSLLVKSIWAILHDAGYYCGYFDPKSTDSGRARRGWHSDRIAPFVEPKGIPLVHYMPKWATANYDHLEHNFFKYSTRLNKINEREMWQGLGMTSIGASKTAKVIKHYNKAKTALTMEMLQSELIKLGKEEIPEGSMNAILRVLTDLADYEVVTEDAKELNLWREWQKGKSICISYNSASRTLMTFDIGQKIKESSRLYFQGNRKPIMWFLDDSSYYAKEVKTVPYNFAIEEILNIGNNYRSLGVYNCMAVQTLGIIDDNVAESYRIKIISPLFQNPDSLSRINIPRKAIDFLKSDELVRDRKNHVMQYLYINEVNDVIPFFPFTPPCNHFSEVYHERSHDEQEA